MKKLVSIILILAMLFSFAACGQSQPVEQSENKEQVNTEEIDLSDDIALMYFGKEYKPGEIIEVGDINTITVLVNGTASVMAVPFEVATDTENALSVIKNDEHSISFGVRTKGTTIVTISTATTSENFILTTKQNLTIADVEKQITEQKRISEELKEIEKNKSTFDYFSAVEKFGNALSFSEVLSIVNSTRINTIVGNLKQSDIEKYAKHYVGETDITKAEIDSMQNKKNLASFITHDQAVSDVRLLFKTMHYGYGPYYYWGEEKFVNAEKEILIKLEGKEKISGADLSKLIKSALSFIVDGHFLINNEPMLDASNTYVYYYSDLVFFKDEVGYYTVLDDEKLYYQSCDNKNTEIRLKLQEDGTLTYGLFQFIPQPQAHKIDEVIFTGPTGEKSIAIKWIRSESYLNKMSLETDYRLLQENGIVYLSNRSYDMKHFKNTLEQYLSDASKIKGAKFIIYDARSSAGGQKTYFEDWIETVFGEKPKETEARNNWSVYPRTGADSRMPQGADWGQENQFTMFSKGSIGKNNMPVIILADENNASAGDAIVRELRTLDNCIFIGTNTNGYMISGNQREYYLTNSGVHMSIGQQLSFYVTPTLREGKGEIPDIWCNPKTALDAVINMLLKYDVADADSVKNLYKKIGHK